MREVYEVFLDLDELYELKKCACFVRTQLRRKRVDTFRYILSRMIEKTNNREEGTISVNIGSYFPIFTGIEISKITSLKFHHHSR